MQVKAKDELAKQEEKLQKALARQKNIAHRHDLEKQIEEASTRKGDHHIMNSDERKLNGPLLDRAMQVLNA